MNRFKSFILIVAMSALLMLIGDVFYGQQGLLIALGISILMNGISYFFSDRMVLKPIVPRSSHRLMIPNFSKWFKT